MSLAAPALEAILKDVRGTPPARRPSLACQLVDLGAGLTETLPPDGPALFDAVIGALAETMDPPALAELSRRLASAPRRPPLPATVAALARHGRVEVAAPLIETADELTDEDLAELAGSRSESHLMALARRRALNELATDAVIERGVAKSLQTLAANSDARISEVGFVNLIQRAKRDAALAERLAARNDIPGELQPFVRALVGSP